VKYLVASASLLFVCLTSIDTHRASANDFIDEAIASPGRVHVTVQTCKNDWLGATFDYLFENRTSINFRSLALKITAFDQFEHIIDIAHFVANGLRPNIRRTGKVHFYNGTCNDIASVLIEDEAIYLWDTGYSEEKKERPRLLELLSFEWLDRASLTTTFPSKQETSPPTKTDGRITKLELKPIGKFAQNIFHDIGACVSEYHVNGDIGTLAGNGETIILGLSNSTMTINDLSNLPFSRTGGTLVNINGDYVEFFQNSYPTLSRVLILENDDLASARGKFKPFKDSNLLFNESYAQLNKPECENMSHEESVRMHEHCYLGSEGITLLTIYKNGNIDSKASGTYCIND